MDHAASETSTSSSIVNASSGKAGASIRVSLACLPCRTRHVRCDAKRPQCDRCIAEGKECNYAKSRRGGLDRATLAARRNRAAAVAKRNSPGDGGRDGSRSCSDSGSGDGRGRGSTSPRHLYDGDSSSASLGNPNYSVAGTPAQYQQRNDQPSLDINRLFTPPAELWCYDFSSSQSPPDSQPINTTRDPYIDLYYKCFHRFHPCVLPRQYLERRLQDPAQQANFKPLIAAMRFIGSLYASPDQTSAPLTRSHRLDQLVAVAVAETPQDPNNFFMAQFHLIYSIAMHWTGEAAKGRHHLDKAIRMAVESGMFRSHFAAEHSCGDPVLQESWRRTWWQIFVVDAFHAAIKKKHIFATLTTEATTELPCEEYEYETGNIPIPKTLEDYNYREFSTDNYVYSSFAYLIGAVRDMATAMSRVLGERSPDMDSPHKMLEAVDAIIDGWLLLLPDSKRDGFSKSGEVDELIFQATMALHATRVGLHRPFSDCVFDPLECMSSCSSPTDPALRQATEFSAVHTVKCIRAAEAQIRLLALPGKPCAHTPFAICMLTTGTLSLLSACRYILDGEKLAVARDQIRMSIGCHKAMASIWPQAGTNLKEVQTIAREVLGLPFDARNNGLVASSNAPLGTAHPNSNTDRDLIETVVRDGTFPVVAMDNIPTYWTVNDMPTDIPYQWWSCGPELN